MVPSLFDPDSPEGFVYRPDFISPDEEALLIDAIRQVEFSNFEMRGVVARRRVAFFGSSYDAGRTRTLPLPAFLRPLRERAAALAGVDAEAFVMALINEYPPGAPIGWHRERRVRRPDPGIATLRNTTLSLASRSCRPAG